MAPNEQIEELLSQAEPVADGIYTLPARLFGQTLKNNRGDWKKVRSVKKDFEFGEAKEVFIGATSKGEEKKRLGFFLAG